MKDPLVLPPLLPPPPGYGTYGPPPPKHPQAVTVLVLGILGILVCGLVGPFAWSMGNRVVGEIEAAGGRWGGESEATIGRILGIVSTVLLALTVLMFLTFFVFGTAMLAGFSTR